MKKLRMILGVFALVLAMGATFATQYNASTTLDGYVLISTDPDVCSERNDVDCEAPNGTPCVINQEEIRDDDTQAGCGQALGKIGA